MNPFDFIRGELNALRASVNYLRSKSPVTTTEGTIDLSAYALKTQIPVLPNLAPYALKTQLPDLSPYATKGQIPDLTPYALSSDIPDLRPYARKTELPDLTPYATKNQLPDLSPFALKTQIPKLPDLTPYATKDQIPTLPDLSPYATKDQLPDLTPFALKTQLPNLTSYALKSQLPTVPDLTPYALKSQLPTVPDLSVYALKNQVPAAPDLSGFALKTDLPAVSTAVYRQILPPFDYYIDALQAANGLTFKEMVVKSDPDSAKNGRYFYDAIDGKLEKVGLTTTKLTTGSQEAVYGTLALSAAEAPNNTFTLNWVKNRSMFYGGGVVFGIGSSTLSGFGATTGNGVGNLVQAWMDANTTGAQLINVAIAGTDSTRYMPDGTSSLVYTQRNITTAVDSKPACIIIFLPTNDIANGIDTQTFVNNIYAMWDYAWLQHGIPTFVISPQPRTAFTTAQKTELRKALTLMRGAFPAEFFIDIYELYNDGSDNTKVEYQSTADQIHLNDAGHQVLSNVIVSRLAAYFLDQTYLQYEIEIDNGAGFDIFDTITSPTVISKVYNRLDGNAHTYRIRGKKADGTYSDYSKPVTFTQANLVGTLEETVQLDLSINTDPANTVLGWNDLRATSSGATAGTNFSGLVNSTGVLAGISMNIVKPFYSAGTNYQPGTFLNYPAMSTQDFWTVLQQWNDYAEIQFTGLNSSKIYELDFISSWKGSDNRRYIVLDSGNSYDRGRGTTNSVSVANTTEVRTLRRLIPTPAGTINIRVRAVGIAGYLNTLVLKKYATTVYTDTTAPNAPTALTSSAVTQTSFTLGWQPAYDNIGTISYDIFKDGVFLSSTTNLTYALTSLTAGTAYAMTVKARDAAGNVSAASAVLNVSTAAVPASDTTPPSAPGTLSATALTQTTLTLNWTASTDNVGVTGYQVFKNGVLLGTTTSAVTYPVSALSAGTAYNFSVKAIDAAGNVSAAATLAVTTSAPVSDSIPPDTPTGLNATSVLDTNFTLNWTAATDNVGVTAYDIYKNGVLLGTTANLSYPVTGLTQSTAYSFTVISKDAAGNQSVASSPLQVTTTGTVVAKEIMVRLYAGANPYANTAWNNWNVGQTATPPDSPALTDTTAAATDITASLSAQDVNGLKDNGTSYSATVTIVPVEAARYSSASVTNTPRTLTIKGLNNAKQYTIELYNNRQYAAGSTVFGVSGYSSVTVISQNNNTGSAVLSGITPVNGQIVVNISATGTNINYLNAFKVRYIG